jgi:hypothetical protein
VSFGTTLTWFAAKRPLGHQKAVEIEASLAKLAESVMGLPLVLVWTIVIAGMVMIPSLPPASRRRDVVIAVDYKRSHVCSFVVRFAR